MEGTNQTVFILDTYNRMENNEGVKRIFQINSNWYCLREVSLEWGEVVSPHFDDENVRYHLFNTLEEANKCVDKMLIAAKLPF